MLYDLLRAGAEEAGDRPLVMAASGDLSYADALSAAEGVAKYLRAEGTHRLGAALVDPRDVVILLAGAAAVGAEVCVYPGHLDSSGVDQLAERFGHEVVVADGVPQLEHARALRPADLRDGTGPPISPADVAPVLILTTGTTGEQKGARHDWRRLARSVRHPDDISGRRWLLAYNLNQFAGLQVLLHVLASRGTLVVPTSRQPRDAIPAIRDAQVTHASATPTFWRLLAGGLTPEAAAELPLEQITLGGEATPASLLDRLRALFPGARISHVYAGTEFGSAVSVRDGRAGLPLSVLDRGEDAEVQLRIVHGELQVRSRAGMLGYHAADGAGEWHRTGDLVEIRDDRIHFVGRASEVINVGGAKVHPLPIEELVAAVEGVELAAAYGRPNPVTGQIVALDVVAAPGFDPKHVRDAIREACAALPPAGRPQRIRFVDALEVRGNKLIRSGDEVGA